ncbi:MAG: alpha/beta hydrolase [Vicinamibacterales bacterium]
MDVAEGRAITFKSGDLNLEGALHLPEPMPAERVPGIVVCHPHPQYGGDMRNNVVEALCEAAVENGLAALRFNFRGVGRSEGGFGAGTDERDDALAALGHLRSLLEIDQDSIALAGYSFGAGVAMRAASPELRALIAVSSPTIAAGGLRSNPLPCPILLIAGDRDEFSDPEALKRFAEESGAELVILPGVDHFWWGSDDRLKENVSSFLERRTRQPLTYTDHCHTQI